MKIFYIANNLNSFYFYKEMQNILHLLANKLNCQTHSQNVKSLHTEFMSVKLSYIKVVSFLTHCCDLKRTFEMSYPKSLAPTQDSY